jgi:hypothetical protein
VALNELALRLRESLAGQGVVYRRVFDPSSHDGEVVLTDLARFCRAHSTTAHKDPATAARLEGRREVWLHVQERLHLTDEQLWLLFASRQPLKGD